ncbi:hypothetical protein ACIU1J_22795 [Azospirillum doebereinerae]|nr:hypothetical protein [Azospirillum doebereinerae]MCG5243536.1 hypothetical protein [Azospirillum doebereinerae]
MLVVDEASMFKNGQMRTGTKQITRFGVAVKARKYASRVVLATGTPTPKGLRNLWGLAKVADGGQRLGDKKHWFETRWFTKDHMGWNLEPRPGAETQIMDRLSDIMFSLDESDCVDLLRASITRLK